MVYFILIANILMQGIIDSCLNIIFLIGFPTYLIPSLIFFQSILHITSIFCLLKHGFFYSYQLESLEVIAK